MRRLGAAMFAGVLAATFPLEAGQQAGDPTATVLTRIGAYVQRYYARSQSVVSVETVTLHALGNDLQPLGSPRRLVYDFRLEWNPAAQADERATVVRELLTVNGRDARPDDEPGCTDPKPVSPEPLAMLLPDRRHDYEFRFTGRHRVGGRPTVRLDYRSLTPGPAEVEWTDDCVSVELPGRTRGRVWADETSGEILRFEEALVGRFEVPVPPRQQRVSGTARLVIERADTTITYKPVTFHDPDETLLLPASIDRLTVIRNAGVPRVLAVQSFTGYRRFVTDARVVR